jgi:hypothetical protein
MFSTHPRVIDHLMFGHEWCLEVSNPPLSYVLKYGLLIGVNEGNSVYKSLINIKVTVMHHTA